MEEKGSLDQAVALLARNEVEMGLVCEQLIISASTSLCMWL